MLAQRLITAAIGIPVILGVILLGGALYTAVAALILAIAALEFVHALSPLVDADAQPRPLWQPRPAALIAAVGAAAMAVTADEGFDEWTAVLIGAIGVGLLFGVSTGDSRRGMGEWLGIVAALAYVGFLGSYVVFLRDLDDDGHWMLLALLGTWVTDTFAYGTGKLIGSHKMAPRVSPGKTWEGTAGALAGGFAGVVVLNWVLDLPVSTGEAALLGLMLPALAVAADLGESMLKRGVGVKDTSELVPGHGGFLDRLDSVLFTVPLVYYFAVWVVLD